MTPNKDGYYWFRNWINLDGGGLVDEWKMAKIEGGLVLLVGSNTRMPPDAPYLKRAVWDGPIVPPPVTSS